MVENGLPEAGISRVGKFASNGQGLLTKLTIADDVVKSQVRMLRRIKSDKNLDW